MNESLCHGIYQLYLFIPTKRRIVRIYTFFFFFFPFVYCRQTIRSIVIVEQRTNIECTRLCNVLEFVPRQFYTHNNYTIHRLQYLDSPASLAVVSHSPFYNSFSPGKYTLYIHISRIVFCSSHHSYILTRFSFSSSSSFFPSSPFFKFFYYNYRCFSLCDNFANLRSLAHRLKSNVDQRCDVEQKMFRFKNDFRKF